MSNSTTARARGLLVTVVVIWAISWPVIKLAVASVSPLWFSCMRYAIAAVCLFGFAAVTGQLVIPSRSERHLVVISGGLQMATYSALTSLSLIVIPAGRASVLAFTTPIWVVPLAAVWLDERVSRRVWLAVMLGLGGIVVIATPAIRHNGTAAIGAYLMLVAAALAWAISIVFVRGHRFTASTLALAPWQALVAGLLLLPIALVVDGPPPPLHARAIASLAYVGPIATAFAYWAVVEVGRQVRAATISIALLATPSLGIALSGALLGEHIGASLLAGVVLIAAGVWLVSRDR